MSDPAMRPHGWRLKAARLALGWSQRRLAKRAGVGINTVLRLERLDYPQPRSVAHGTLRWVLLALEQAGGALPRERAGGDA